jgi:hypothetical protein
MANDDDPGPRTSLARLIARHPELARLVAVMERSVDLNEKKRGRGPKVTDPEARKTARRERDFRAVRGDELRRWARQLEEWFPPTRVERPLFTFDPDDPALQVEEVRPTTDLEVAEDALGFTEPLAERLRTTADLLDHLHDTGGMDVYLKPALAVLDWLARYDGYGLDYTDPEEPRGRTGQWLKAARWTDAKGEEWIGAQEFVEGKWPSRCMELARRRFPRADRDRVERAKASEFAAKLLGSYREHAQKLRTAKVDPRTAKARAGRKRSGS